MFYYTHDFTILYFLKNQLYLKINEKKKTFIPHHMRIETLSRLEVKDYIKFNLFKINNNKK